MLQREVGMKLLVCLLATVTLAEGLLNDRSLQPRKSKLRMPTAEFQRLLQRQNARVSFKECSIDIDQRIDCGYYGIDEEGCYQRGCCYAETDAPHIPWCYHSKPTTVEKCMSHPSERVDCGYAGIRKDQCLAQNCCWQPKNMKDVPWCYHYRKYNIHHDECGVPAILPNVRQSHRIVGGTEAKAHSWPWQVSMQMAEGHFCGASILNERWLITAAHCEPGFMGDRTTMVVGAHSQFVDDTESHMVQRIEVADVIPHEHYDDINIQNDIMLVKLKEPITFNDWVSPICLANKTSRPSPGTRCYVTGWGTTTLMGESPEVLNQVAIPVLHHEICNEWYSDPEHWYVEVTNDTDIPSITREMICAGYEEGGRGGCHGDSGGPFVCYADDHWELQGIVSWGGPCAYERTPSVFTRVSNFIDWIENTATEHQ